MRRSLVAAAMAALSCSALILGSAASAAVPPASAEAPSTAGPPAAASDPFRIPYEKLRLSNGLEVILSHDDSKPVVAVNVWYHVGSRDEPPGRSGLAHLFEHMMFHGSRNIESPWMDGGTEQNATTSFDRTNYFQTIPAHRLEAALWVESDRMAYFLDALEEEGVEKEKGVVKNERRERHGSSRFDAAQDRAWVTLFPAGHPYSTRVIGSMEDLDAATLEELRTFYETWYDPSNATLVVVGDFDREEAIRLIEGYFASLPSVPPAKTPQPAAARLERTIVLRENTSTKHPLVQFQWHAPPIGHPDASAGAAVAQMLARRLRHALPRDKAEDLSVYVIPLEWQSVFTIRVSVAKGESTDEIAARIEDVVASMDDPTVDCRDLPAFLDARKNGALSTLQRVGGRAHLLQHYNRYFGEPDGLRLELAALQSMGRLEIARYVREVLSRPKVILHAGPGQLPEPLVEVQASKGVE